VGWWYPYDDARRRGFAAMIEALYSPGMTRKAQSVVRRRDELGKFLKGLFSRNRRT
jgi:hypothetical protein